MQLYLTNIGRFLVISFFVFTMVACEKDGGEASPSTPDTVLDRECYPFEYSTSSEMGYLASFKYDADYKIIRLDETYDGDYDGYTEYKYDSDGMLLRSDYHGGGGEVSSYQVYEYNSDNLISSITTYSFDGGSIEKGTSYTYTYNPSQQISKASFYYNENGKDKLFTEYLYEYNSSRQIIRMKSTKPTPLGVSQSVTEYQYENGLLVKAETTGSGGSKTIRSYEYGDENGYAASMYSKNPVFFNYPLPNPSESYEKVLTKKLITNELNELINKEESFTASYEYNEHGYPVKTTMVDFRGKEETAFIKYECP